MMCVIESKKKKSQGMMMKIKEDDPASIKIQMTFCDF